MNLDEQSNFLMGPNLRIYNPMQRCLSLLSGIQLTILDSTMVFINKAVFQSPLSAVSLSHITNPPLAGEERPDANLRLFPTR